MELILTGTGTSQGVPVIGCECAVCNSSNPKDRRLRSAALLRADEHSGIAIDCGPDFRQQMLAVGQESLSNIILTHEHMDHIAGIDDVRAFNFTAKVRMKLYATDRVHQQLSKQFAYAFHTTPYPGAPQIDIHRIDRDKLEIDGVEVTPIPVQHGNWPVLGFRIGNVAYITDVNHIPESSVSLLTELDTLVLGVLHRKPHHSHFNLEEGIAMAQKVNARQTYFTHISHNMGLADEVSGELPNGIDLAYDGLRIPVKL